MKVIFLVTLLNEFFGDAIAIDMGWGKMDQINHPHVIDSFNDPDSTWIAGENHYFNQMTFGQAQVLLMSSNFAQPSAPTDVNQLYRTQIPVEFDATDGVVFPRGSISPIRDQQQCGSCWAFSAVEVLTDRFRIQTNNTAFPVLSPEDLVACDTLDMGCGGGELSTAWTFLSSSGVVSDTCRPYSSGGGAASACIQQCAGDEEYTKYHASDAKPIHGVENMQMEILKHGPIQVAFKVYKSFMTYRSGVYMKKKYEIVPEGGHAVKIVGWGATESEDYWVVANSWNTTWGMDGYFWISRGSDQCGIETLGPPYTGQAKVDGFNQ